MPRDRRNPRANRTGRVTSWRWGLIVIPWIAACGSGPTPVPLPGPEGDFARAKAQYDRGDMLEAITLLEAFEKEHPGSQYIDDALFLLGKAHQGNGEQILARESFQRLLDDYPRSPFAEESQYELAHSWSLSVRGVELDPEPIEEALRAHRIYLARYPEGSHAAEAREGERAALGLLARKDCLNGETYLKAGRCAAARRYFGLSLARWAESPVSARALNGIARSHECENAPDSARAAYERLLAHLGEDAARYEKGEELARRAREKLARGATSGS